MHIAFLDVEESDRMQLEENGSGPFSSRLNNIHLQSRIHLQVHYTSTLKHAEKEKSAYSTACGKANNEIESINQHRSTIVYHTWFHFSGFT